MKSEKVTRYFVATPVPMEAGCGWGIHSDEVGQLDLAAAKEAASELSGPWAVVQRSERIVYVSEL